MLLCPRWRAAYSRLPVRRTRRVPASWRKACHPRYRAPTHTEITRRRWQALVCVFGERLQGRKQVAGRGDATALAALALLYRDHTLAEAQPSAVGLAQRWGRESTAQGPESARESSHPACSSGWYRLRYEDTTPNGYTRRVDFRPHDGSAAASLNER